MLFGILHSANLLGGKQPLYVILQVIFAFIFALVCSEIVVITKSLIPVILWHTLHDFIAYITNDNFNNLALIILAVQCVILIIFAFVLWRKIEDDKKLISVV